MPFLEVFSFERSEAKRATLSRALTDALADAFAIEPGIVSIYHFVFGAADYAHDGRLAPGARHERVFIKVHAFRRSRDERSAAVAAMTTATCDGLGVAPENVTIYFLDREKDEVAHAGKLASG